MRADLLRLLASGVAAPDAVLLYITSSQQSKAHYTQIHAPAFP